MPQCPYQQEDATPPHPINGKGLPAFWSCQANGEHTNHELPPNAVGAGIWYRRDIDAQADPCQYIVDKKVGTICGKQAVTGIDHPLYDSKLARVCKDHEPRTCSDCDGHIMGGECHCET